MKHSIAELCDIVYSYFPRGMQGNEPDYKETPEYQRRMAARVPASGRFRDWCAMLDRLRARFPAELRDIGVQNGSHFLASPGASTLDRCFSGALWLHPRAPQETHHQLEFYVSFVAPYFFLHSSCMSPITGPAGADDVDLRISFDLTPDEVPFAAAIEEEIQRDFPGYERMPPEVGKTIVPEVVGGGNLYGESTIYGCLFSDNW
jgi:hypothetical protein